MKTDFPFFTSLIRNKDVEPTRELKIDFPFFTHSITVRSIKIPRKRPRNGVSPLAKKRGERRAKRPNCFSPYPVVLFGLFYPLSASVFVFFSTSIMSVFCICLVRIATNFAQGIQIFHIAINADLFTIPHQYKSVICLFLVSVFVLTLSELQTPLDAKWLNSAPVFIKFILTPRCNQRNSVPHST
jgi:hypothetical protein